MSQSPTSELGTRREETPFIDGSKLDSSPYQFQDPKTELSKKDRALALTHSNDEHNPDPTVWCTWIEPPLACC